MKKVVIGSDHAGFDVKERIKKELGDQYEFVDVGPDNDEASDYPIYGEKVAQQVAVTPDVQGVVVCGSGIGISIAANKVPGIRAALCYSKEAAQSARQHNDANVISIAGRTKMMDDPATIVKTFLETDFSHVDRHERRVKQMMDIERHSR
ncbi:RpiB/LacA/LacB family sugar-phosphate isomerase [Patescibacteria group bacterium]|nr:RpiB/LacA/LacB family sugar-phosphate isomerase [Patescibacteria group bacterium]MBU1683728.1 RpiB/LacA/LacB family sugar-phosphate isomerase [Patescibacteria group bacterium]